MKIKPNLYFKFVVTYHENGKRYRHFVGIDGLTRYAGEQNANKAITRAFTAGLDKCTIRLRRGLTIEIYSK